MEEQDQTQSSVEVEAEAVEQEQEQQRKRLEEDNVVQFLDSLDGYVTLLDSLSSTIRQVPNPNPNPMHIPVPSTCLFLIVLQKKSMINTERIQRKQSKYKILLMESVCVVKHTFRC
jgi:hypothetical protein